MFLKREPSGSITIDLAPDPEGQQSGIFRRLTILSAAGAIFISVLGLLGYLPGMRMLSSIRLDFIPMAPSTALSFILLSLVVLGATFIRTRRRGNAVMMIVAMIVALFGLSVFLEHYLGINFPLEELLAPPGEKLGEIPVGEMSPATGALFIRYASPTSPAEGEMSPATGALFILASAGVLLFLARAEHSETARRTRNIVSGLALLTTLAGAVFLLNYLYGTPLMYGGSVVPMAVTTAIAFCLFGLSLCAAVGPDSIPARVFNGGSTRARLSRVFIPLSVIAVFLQSEFTRLLPGIIHINEAFLLALLAVVMATLAAIVVASVSDRIGGSIDRAERELQRVLSEQRATLLSIGDAVIVTEAGGHLTLMNQIACELTGWTLDDARGRPLGDVFT